MSKIITLTLNTALDCVIKEKDFLLNGPDIDLMDIIAAGKGLNVSRALESNGEASVCLGFVGLDDQKLFEGISSPLITTDFIYVPGSTRKNITLSECKDGLEHHETNPGFMIVKEVFNKQIDTLSSYINAGDYIVFSGSLPRGLEADTYQKLIRLCQKKGLTTILDTSGPALKEGIKACPNIIKPNLDELMSLTDLDLSNKESMQSFIRKLSNDNSIDYVLTTLSKDGALLYVNKEDRFIEAPSFSDNDHKHLSVISSVGCGDCSLAGFVYGIKNGYSTEQALDLSMKWAYFNLFTTTPGQM